MENREFYWNCDGIDLHMKLDFPDTESDAQGRYPLCILVHGYTGHMEEDHLLAVRDALLESGTAVLRAELYGHGKSGGEFRDHTILLWVHELVRIIDYARSLPFAGRLYLAGHSQGGAASVLAAGLMGDCLAGLLPLAPALAIRKGAREGQLLGCSFDPNHIPELLQMDPEHELRSAYVRVAKHMPFEEAAASYRGPVMLIHASDDMTIPLSDSLWLQERYADARLAVVSGGDHCYVDHLDEVKEAVRKFMAECPGL